MGVHRRLLLLAATMALVGASAALAQAPISGPSAGTLARGGAGIALTHEHATGLMNPAALTMLTRVPSEHPGEASTASGETAWHLPAHPNYGGMTSIDLRRPGRDEQMVRLLSLAGDGEAVALAPSGLGPTSAVSQAVAGRQPLQVAIETRFVTMDQDWLRDVAIDWRNPVVFQAGYDFNIDADWEFDAFQAVGGRMNDPWAFALGYIDEAYQTRIHLSAARAVSGGRLLAIPRVTALDKQKAEFSVGATLSHHSYPDRAAGDGDTIDPVLAPTRDDEITLDLGAVWNQDRLLFGEPVRTSAGVVVYDVGNSLASPDWDSRDLGVGVGATGERWRAGLDLVPVIEDDQVRLTVEVQPLDRIVISGALREGGEKSWGVRGKVPLLKDIPMVNFFFSHDQHEERVGLMILVTPHIIDEQ